MFFLVFSCHFKFVLWSVGKPMFQYLFIDHTVGLINLLNSIFLNCDWAADSRKCMKRFFLSGSDWQGCPLFSLCVWVEGRCFHCFPAGFPAPFVGKFFVALGVFLRVQQWFLCTWNNTFQNGGWQEAGARGLTSFRRKQLFSLAFITTQSKGQITV